jgi:hypothetical protein
MDAGDQTLSILAISARDLRGFCPDQKVWLDDRRPHYALRPEHIMAFSNRERLEHTLQAYFEAFEFLETDEIDSVSNAVSC